LRVREVPGVIDRPQVLGVEIVEDVRAAVFNFSNASDRFVLASSAIVLSFAFASVAAEPTPPFAFANGPRR